MNPLAVSYDWGLLTDLGRINQSNDIEIRCRAHLVFRRYKEKRKFVNKNLVAWLRKPEFGMIPLLITGDKCGSK